MSILRTDLDAGRVDFGDVITGEELSPIHPGEILLEDFVKPLGITAYKLAKETHVPHNRVSAILKCKRGITVDTARRFAKALNTSAQFWINLQMSYDLEMSLLNDQENMDIEEIHPLPELEYA
jgi:addiction module HigA family antidote